MSIQAENLGALDDEMHEDRLSKKRQALQDDLDAEDVAYGKPLDRLIARSTSRWLTHSRSMSAKPLT
jgi:hypothetical protein